MKNLRHVSLPELQQLFIDWSEPKFRAAQVYDWLWKKHAASIEEMSNLPKQLREKLEQSFFIPKVQIYNSQHSNDGTIKSGLLLEDKRVVEGVLIPTEKRMTACVSCQVGCSLNCSFCATGFMERSRNLTYDEIIDEVTLLDQQAQQAYGRGLSNIVFMGMGEALSNFETFLNSLEIFMHEDIYNIGGRRITVSTAGVVPSIERLLKEKLNIGLAISLNSYSNELRDQLMPINKKYPIESIVAIARRYAAETGRTVTFEYVVIDGKTNTPEALQEIHRYCGGFDCKINLIPLNPSTGSALAGPEDDSLQKFADALERKGITATIRKSRGQDIWGACGQLAGKRIFK